MTYNRQLLNKLGLAGKTGFPPGNDGESTPLTDMMSDADYLRQSSSLINDALQKGFDVLQLADGDIVMTGVKTVVYQYTWDTGKKKLVRARAKTTKKRAVSAAPKVDEFEAEEEIEEAEEV